MKVIVLTGTSSGLGKAFFDLLCNEPFYLICLSRRFLPYQEDLATKRKKDIELLIHDLSKVDDFHYESSLSDNLPSEKIDEIIFINNAGVIEPIAGIGKLNRESILKSVNVNLVNPILITNTLSRICRSLGAKLKVLNISTGAADRPIEGWSMYCATKAGSKMFFEVLREEVNKDVNVSIYHIDPGVMNTKMQEEIRSSGKDDFPLHDYFVNLKNKKQLAQPKEVAENIIDTFIKQ